MWITINLNIILSFIDWIGFYTTSIKINIYYIIIFNIRYSINFFIASTGAPFFESLNCLEFLILNIKLNILFILLKQLFWQLFGPNSGSFELHIQIIYSSLALLISFYILCTSQVTCQVRPFEEPIELYILFTVIKKLRVNELLFISSGKCVFANGIFSSFSKIYFFVKNESFVKYLKLYPLYAQEVTTTIITNNITYCFTSSQKF